MSNPYGPPITTIQGWNEALGCCCGMPVPPEPIIECETIQGEAYISGYFPPGWANGDPIPQREVHTYKGSNPFIQTFARDVATSIGIGGVTVQNPVQSISDNGGTTFGSPIASTYFDSVNQKAARDAASAIILAGIDFEDAAQYKYSVLRATRYEAVAYTGAGFGGRILLIEKSRYRWRVPVSHLGTYFKITWDVLYEPIGWNDTAIPVGERPIRYSRKNLTVEWTGPGTGAQSNASWLAGDWQMLEVPEEPGERRIINIRFTQFSDGP